MARNFTTISSLTKSHLAWNRHTIGKIGIWWVKKEFLWSYQPKALVEHCVKYKGFSYKIWKQLLDCLKVINYCHHLVKLTCMHKVCIWLAHRPYLSWPRSKNKERFQPCLSRGTFPFYRVWWIRQRLNIIFSFASRVHGRLEKKVFRRFFHASTPLAKWLLITGNILVDFMGMETEGIYYNLATPV